MHRAVHQISRVAPQPGTGIQRPFPTRELPQIDPFVFLDTGTPKQLGDHSIYVGPHPHRGVQPVSLLFRGRIEHRDSLGHHRIVDSGGMQWLVSGSGALHEEVLGGDEEGVFHMAQLWVNVPAELKMADPEHHAVDAEAVPELTSLGEGSLFRLYAGRLAGQDGPAPLPTPVLVGHLTLEPGGEATIEVPAGWNAAFTVVAGTVDTHGQSGLRGGDTPVFGHDGDTLHVSSPSGGQVLVMCGAPIHEPLATGGGFVMNTSAEVQQAFDDYRSGRMGELAPTR